MQKILFITGTILGNVLPALAQSAAKEENLAKIENFKTHDPYGVSMSIISMGVVFIALIVLFLCFKWSGKLLNRGLKKTAAGAGSHRNATFVQVSNKKTGEKADSEIVAAIGMALFLAEDGMHDIESEELTFLPSEQSWTGRGNNQKQEPWRKF